VLRNFKEKAFKQKHLSNVDLQQK